MNILQRVIPTLSLDISPVLAQEYDSFIDTLMNQTKLDSLVSYVRVLSGEDSVQLGDSTVLIQEREGVITGHFRMRDLEQLQ